MSGDGAGSGAAPLASAATDIKPGPGARHVGIHWGMMVTALVAFIATYAGVQYLIARQQVVAFAERRTGVSIAAVSIASFSSAGEWQVGATWAISKSGHAGTVTVFTTTSWLGLGRTTIGGFLGYDAGR